MAAILGGAFPCQKPQNGEEKGVFIYWNDTNAKTVSNLFLLGFPVFRMTNACQEPAMGDKNYSYVKELYKQ